MVLSCGRENNLVERDFQPKVTEQLQLTKDKLAFLSLLLSHNRAGLPRLGSLRQHRQILHLEGVGLFLLLQLIVKKHLFLHFMGIATALDEDPGPPRKTCITSCHGELQKLAPVAGWVEGGGRGGGRAAIHL